MPQPLCLILGFTHVYTPVHSVKNNYFSSFNCSMCLYLVAKIYYIKKKNAKSKGKTFNLVRLCPYHRSIKVAKLDFVVHKFFESLWGLENFTLPSCFKMTTK